MSDENALDTADVVNKVNPDFVRIRTFVAKAVKMDANPSDDNSVGEIKKCTGAGDNSGDIRVCTGAGNNSAGEIRECTDREKALELKKMIENINVDSVDGYLYSDHIVNLFETVNGSIKTERAKMLSVFDDFLALGAAEQRAYQVARRMDMVRSLSNMPFLSGEQREKIDSYLSRLESEAEFEAFLSRLLRQYI